MAETTDQVKAEIAQTREELGATLDAISSQVDATRRKIPFYGSGANRQLLLVAGSLIATTCVFFLALYAIRRMD